MRPGLIALGLLLAPMAAASPQAETGVDQKRVDDAINRGIEFLKPAAIPPIAARADLLSEELVLWAFVQAGVPYEDPRFQTLWKTVVSRPLQRTYDVALLAMILEEVDRVRYQKRILHCAQFLVDNMCRNGQWDYGSPTLAVPDVPLKDLELVPPKLTLDPKGRKVKPKVVRKFGIRKTRDGPDQGGCHSNAQYAALGLRACADAGIAIPMDVLTIAKQSWIETERREKGVPGGGWCYENPTHGCDATHPPNCGMTAGGVGSLLIYHHLLGSDGLKDPAVKDGLAWLEKSFSWKENWSSKVTCPARKRNTQFMIFYSIYALERAGRLARIEKIGERFWYPEGARSLLERQNKDGSWGPCDYSNTVLDTCFAILFLKRATRPLNDVASEDKYIPSDK